MSETLKEIPLPESSLVGVLMVEPEHEMPWCQCERLQYDVYLRSNYLKENSEKRLVGFESYPHSVFLAAYLKQPNKLRRDAVDIVGAMRLFYTPDAVKMREGLFPTLDQADKSHFFPDTYEKLMNLNPLDIINIGPVTVKEDKRASEAFANLVYAFGYYCLENRYMYGLIAYANMPLRELMETQYSVVELSRNSTVRGVPVVVSLIDMFDEFENR